ncbi:unnamed protein product [Clonostachys chloroleuca]|uniref:Uncharacterized protein n=1 Tax=Clonostachys chloroleuca TaxID=1926264 RepID=A0AA35MDG1_9HYPO|nr:unnamed protein product [Clonostachys chloroleuca]
MSLALAHLRSAISQSFPPRAIFTEKDVPDLQGKVCIVTGSNTGVGKEIAQILYAKNAKVYLAARSEEKTRKAIDDIKAASPNTTKGQMEYLHLDLADLSAVRSASEEFLSKESQLHLLFNNAGLGYPEKGLQTAQGHELQLGVNCVGPFLFTQRLTPTIVSTARNCPKDSVRVIWASSSATEGYAVNGNWMDYIEHPEKKSSFELYATSKMGNYFYGAEYAARHKADGVISVSLNPGHLDSDFWRSTGRFLNWLLRVTVLYPSVYGAYTNIFSAFSPQVTSERSGSFVAPWGRLWQVTPDKANAVKPKKAGGLGVSQTFWEWSETQVKDYM